jgi:hypothetical protein
MAYALDVAESCRMTATFLDAPLCGSRCICLYSLRHGRERHLGTALDRELSSGEKKMLLVRWS